MDVHLVDGTYGVIRYFYALRVTVNVRCMENCGCVPRRGVEA